MNPPGILKYPGKATSTVVPINSDVYPMPAYPNGQPYSSQISFIASSMSMMQGGAATDSSHQRIKLSECELEEDLQPLYEKNMVFVRQLHQDIERYINVPNKYQIVSSSGDKLYDVVETTDGVTRRLFRRDQPFTMRIINSYGEYICELEGDPGVGGLGAYVKLKRESKMLGKVVQVNPFFACCNFSPSYNLQNQRGKTVAKIVWQRGRLKSCLFTDDFQVLSVRGSRRLIGSISRQTKALCLEDYNSSDSDTYALTFQDNQTDKILRALLVATVIMLDFQFFEGREGSELWKVCICCLIVILVGLIIAGIIVFIVFESAKS